MLKGVSMTPEPETVCMTIKLVGSHGQLDIAEGEYTVTNIEDIAKRAKDIIYEYGRCYSNYGWSIAWGIK